MTMWYTPNYLGGKVGKHRYPRPQTSGSATDPTHPANLGATTISQITGTGTFNRAFKSSPVEDAGIRAGEIIAYRAWSLNQEGLLHSMIIPHVWEQGVVEKINAGTEICPDNSVGFYAFKTMDKVEREFWWAEKYGVIYGEVALWGTVIEHEHGYRGEFAKIVKLCNWTDARFGLLRGYKSDEALEALRKKYGVPNE